MKKYLYLLELKTALFELNQKKGLPVEIVSIPTQSFVRFKAIRDFNDYKRQFTYNQSPYKLIESLKALPDISPKYNWSLLGKFL